MLFCGFVLITIGLALITIWLVLLELRLFTTVVVFFTFMGALAVDYVVAPVVLLGEPRWAVVVGHLACWQVVVVAAA